MLQYPLLLLFVLILYPYTTTTTAAISTGKYLVVPTTTGIKLKESLQQAGLDSAAKAASLAPLVRENDAGELVFTGKLRSFHCDNDISAPYTPHPTTLTL